MNPATSGRPRRLERGGVSWVTLLLLLAFASGGYLGWVWVPLYVELYAVKQVVRDHMNQAIKNPDDGALRRNLVAKLRSLADVEQLDELGEPVLVPAIQVDEADVAWERDREGRAPTLRIAFAYERAVVYPILDRADVTVFEVDLTSDLRPADWGPSR